MKELEPFSQLATLRMIEFIVMINYYKQHIFVSCQDMILIGVSIVDLFTMDTHTGAFDKSVLLLFLSQRASHGKTWLATRETMLMSGGKVKELSAAACVALSIAPQTQT